MFHNGMIINERLNRVWRDERMAEAAAERLAQRENTGLTPALSLVGALLTTAAGMVVWAAWTAHAA